MEGNIPQNAMGLYDILIYKHYMLMCLDDILIYKHYMLKLYGSLLHSYL